MSHPSTFLVLKDIMDLADKYNINLPLTRNQLSLCPPPTNYPDGDLVLGAQYRSVHRPTQYFRVHRFFLSFHSIIFADMLRLPSPADVETRDGVPLVMLTDDGEDVAELLNFVYNPA